MLYAVVQNRKLSQMGHVIWELSISQSFSRDLNTTVRVSQMFLQALNQAKCKQNFPSVWNVCFFKGSAYV